MAWIQTFKAQYVKANVRKTFLKSDAVWFHTLLSGCLQSVMQTHAGCIVTNEGVEAMCTDGNTSQF